jgi:HSP20 family molecular chaperone IbpA
MRDKPSGTESAEPINAVEGTNAAVREQRLSPQEKGSTPLKLVSADVLRDRMVEIHDTIARHAYHLFELRGCEHGHDLEDWFAAESEVLHLCRRDLRESADSIVCTFELGGGFTADQLNVSVEPHRVTISGERNVDGLLCDSSGTHQQRRPQHVFRILDLPAEVDPSSAAAILKGETIEILMPKVGSAKHGDSKAKAASSR